MTNPCTPDAAGVGADTMIPDLLEAHPRARRVLDRYGLRGCGGRLGPVESLGFFARAHGVPQERLLADVREVVGEPKSAATPATPEAPSAEPSDAEAPDVADTIYRRYFLAAIALILTAGATWGAWLLWQIGIAGRFTGVSVHHVNAHGQAQVYGWIGLFVMGFAYQAFPRMWQTRLVGPRLAVLAFVLMAAGILVRALGMTVIARSGYAVGAAMLGAAAQVAAVLIFAGQVVLTFRRSGARIEPWVGFVLVGVLWLVAQAGLDAWHTYKTMTATTRDELLWYVATYQAPLRDLQIHGLALFMILGVSMRMLPALLGVPEVTARRAWWGLGVLSAAVAGEAVLFIVYRWTQNHALAALLMVPWLLLAAGCWMVAGRWRLWRPLPVRERSGKFVRAAYAWLAVSLVMLLMLPVYQAASGITFSHAYYGAIRHAITVGFVSMMIMGMAARVVPTLNGVDASRLTALWGPFLLINVGCFLRVSLQTLTDWHAGFFAAVGVSGVLEVTALGWWGAHLAGIMLGWADCAEARREVVGERPDYIGGDMVVADVLRWFPETAEVFDAYGFTLLRNPVARRTLARGVTVRRAAGMRGVGLGALVGDLAAAARVGVEHASVRPVPLTVKGRAAVRGAG